MKPTNPQKDYHTSVLVIIQVSDKQLSQHKNKCLERLLHNTCNSKQRGIERKQPQDQVASQIQS